VIRPYDKFERLKDRGNKLFQVERYPEACKLYYEAILEIEEALENGTKRTPALSAIETSCRLNYATAKGRQK